MGRRPSTSRHRRSRGVEARGHAAGAWFNCTARQLRGPQAETPPHLLSQRPLQKHLLLHLALLRGQPPQLVTNRLLQLLGLQEGGSEKACGWQGMRKEVLRKARVQSTGLRSCLTCAAGTQAMAEPRAIQLQAHHRNNAATLASGSSRLPLLPAAGCWPALAPMAPSCCSCPASVSGAAEPSAAIAAACC